MAFDKVPREKLLKKLNAHGVRGNLLRWIISRLDKRRQRVVLNGRSSGWQGIAWCVTVICAGSCSLPGLHNNLLSRCVGSPSATAKKFAHNTKLGQTATTGHETQLCRSVQISYQPGPPLEAWHSMLRNAWSCALEQEISSIPKKWRKTARQGRKRNCQVG
jgi:hypothetical protein